MAQSVEAQILVVQGKIAKAEGDITAIEGTRTAAEYTNEPKWIAAKNELTELRKKENLLLERQAGASTSSTGGYLSLLTPPSKVWVLKTSIFNAPKGSRSILQDRMVANNIKGHIERKAPDQVYMHAVSHPDNDSLRTFLTHLISFAPPAKSRLPTSEPAHLVVVSGPELVSDAESLKMLYQPVQVFKLTGTVRNKFVGDPSTISDDPDDAISTRASQSSAERYGPV